MKKCKDHVLSQMNKAKWIQFEAFSFGTLIELKMFFLLWSDDDGIVLFLLLSVSPCLVEFEAW